MHRYSNLLAIVLAVLIAGFFSPGVSVAVNPDEVLSDSVLEQRARALSTKLRCLVCQNQSIDDSDASLARDLRILVRTRLVSGDSDDQVIDYIVSRYGDFVLLQPRFNLNTFILWLMPIFLIVVGFLSAFLMFRKRKLIKTDVLSPEEHSRISKLMERSE